MPFFENTYWKFDEMTLLKGFVILLLITLYVQLSRAVLRINAEKRQQQPVGRTEQHNGLFVSYFLTYVAMLASFAWAVWHSPTDLLPLLVMIGGGLIVMRFVRLSPLSSNTTRTLGPLMERVRPLVTPSLRVGALTVSGIAVYWLMVPAEFSFEGIALTEELQPTTDAKSKPWAGATIVHWTSLLVGLILLITANACCQVFDRMRQFAGLGIPTPTKSYRLRTDTDLLSLVILLACVFALVITIANTAIPALVFWLVGCVVALLRFVPVGRWLGDVTLNVLKGGLIKVLPTVS